MTATFEDIQRPRDIALHVSVWRFEGVAHAGLRGEMDDPLELLPGEQLGDAIVVGEIELYETECRQFFEPGEARLLQRNVVVVIQVIETDDVVAPPDQEVGHMRAYETRGAGNEDFHSRPSTWAAGKTCLMS